MQHHIADNAHHKHESMELHKNNMVMSSDKDSGVYSQIALNYEEYDLLMNFLCIVPRKMRAISVEQRLEYFYKLKCKMQYFY